MDDWEEQAFNTRHVHNRVGHTAAGSEKRSNATFNVRKTFGTFDLNCPAANALGAASASEEPKAAGAKGRRKQKPSGSPKQGATLDIYRLYGRDALVGRISMPAVLDASMVLSGSRKSLAKALESLEAEAEPDQEPEEASAASPAHEATQDGHDSLKQETTSRENASGDDEPASLSETNAGEHDSEEEDEDEDEDDSAGESSESGSHPEDRERAQYAAFEKNSFRNPKFWLHWKGRILTSAASTGASAPEDGTPTDGHSNSISSGKGYIVFTGNDARKFKGTISCAPLGWEDVSIKGWKLNTTGDRDVAIAW